MFSNSNINSLSSVFNLMKTKYELAKSYEKLSSGMKINRASDDPAGLVISEQMRSRISEISQLIKNLEYQNNKFNVAEGGLAAMQVNLQQIRDVALAASDDAVVTDEMRRAYQNIADRNIEGLNNIIRTTSYGTQTILNGAEGAVADIDQLSRIDISDPESARRAVEQIDSKMDEILTIRADIGAKQKFQIGSSQSNLQTELLNLTASESSIRDSDMAREYANMISYEIRLKAGMSLLAHRSVISRSIINIIAR